MPDKTQRSGADSKLLLRLISLESKLLELYAESRWGCITAYRLNKTIYELNEVAWDTGWEYSGRFSSLSDACTDVLSSVKTLSEKITPGEWNDAVGRGEYDRCGYERTVEKKMREWEIKAKDEKRIFLDSIPFRKICGDPNGSDGYVYIQEMLSRDTNFCVKEMYNDEKIIAVLSNESDAIAAARYAASHDGGSGDVCIISSPLPVTHHSFNDWFMN